MQIILSQDVAFLGKIGDVVKVKDGYARNFLIPKNLAYAATSGNLKRIEKLQEKKKAKNQEEIDRAQELAEKLNKVSCTVNVEVNDLDKLYGAVTETEIVQAIDQEGFQVEKNSLILEKSVDELGIFEIGVKLHPEVTAKVRLWVTKK